MSNKIIVVLLATASLAIDATAQRNCYSLLLKSDSLLNTARWGEAAPVLNEAYQVCLEQHGFESDENAWVHHNLAIYNFMITLNRKKADSLEIIAEDLYIRHCGANSIEYGLVRLAKGNLLLSVGKNIEAMECAITAESIFKQQLGIKHQSYGAACNALGVIYNTLGYFDRSAEFMNYALSLERALKGTSSSQYANRLNNIGTIYFFKGEYEQADQYFREANRILTTIGDTVSQNFFNIAHNRGNILLMTGQYKPALMHYDKLFAYLQEHGIKKT